MSSLTDTAYYAKKALKYGSIALIALMVLKVAYGAFISYWKAAHPLPSPPPEVKFGKLPKIKFPEVKTPLPSLTYRLQTIDGLPPNLPNVGNVYFVSQPGPNLLAIDRAKEKAKKNGFAEEPTLVSATLYQWQGKTNPPTSLEINIITNSFKLSYPYKNDPSLIGDYPPSNSKAVSLAQGLLANFGATANDIQIDQTKISYLRLENNNLVNAIALSETQFLRINAYRTNLNDLPILSPNPKQALISFLISNSPDQKKAIVEANYTYHPIEREVFSDYPLKAAAQGWQELQNSQGYIASLGRNGDGKITIRRIYLAYFESDEAQKFIQPIFVFEGDNDFYAYIDAVNPSMTE